MFVVVSGNVCGGVWYCLRWCLVMFVVVSGNACGGVW